MSTTQPIVHSRRSAGLLFVGGGVLLYRTIALITQARRVLRPWVIALTVVEMMIDAITMAGSVRWWRSRLQADSAVPLRAGAAATIVHALRVAVFVAGRTPLLKDFDVRPEHAASHRGRWSWSEVVFASVMSTAGLVGLTLMWRRRRRADEG